jgi:hypothetical protein
MAVSARTPQLAKAAGSYTEIAWGVDAAAGTSSVITVPQFGVVFTALVGGNTSTTAPFVDTVSGNTFTITKASGDVITWIAFGTARY